MSIVTHGQARATLPVYITNDPPATRPAALPLIVAGLPDDPVMDAPQFVGWRWWWDAEKAKWTKPPYRPSDGRKASHSKPADWTSRPRAVASVARHDFDGIGLVLTTATGIVAIDLDHCHDPQTGTIDPWALAWVAHFASYTEISPSGAGLRILIRATMPAGGKKHGDTEAYGNARYVTLTGHRLPAWPAEIAPRQPQLAAFMLAAFPSAAPAASTPRAPQPVTEDDTTLIERAKSADDGRKFARLWAGDLADVAGDPSAGDYRLAFALAFWTDRDQPRIARLMAASGLRRDKWDSPRGETTWLAGTIARACANQPDSYATRLGTVTTGGGASTPPAPAEPDAPPAGALTATERAELVRLRAENPALRERAVRAERELYVTRQGLMNQTAKTLVRPGLGIAWHIREKLQNPRLPAYDIHFNDDGQKLVRFEPQAAGRLAGLSDDPVRKAAKVLQERGQLITEQAKVHGPYFDPRTKQMVVGEHMATFAALPTADVADWIEQALVPAEPEANPKTGQPKAWGGVRPQCAEHPDAGTITTTVTRCAICKKQLKAIQEKHDARGQCVARASLSGDPLPQLAEEDTPPPPVVTTYAPQLAEEGSPVTLETRPAPRCKDCPQTPWRDGYCQTHHPDAWHSVLPKRHYVAVAGGEHPPAAAGLVADPLPQVAADPALAGTPAPWDGTHACAGVCGRECYAVAGTVPYCLPCARQRAAGDAGDVAAADD